LAGPIQYGRRRLQGHLLPQTLSQHLGLAEAPQLRCRRIVRLAVQPALQGRGLGSRVLDAVRATAQAAGLDYLGASFGATPALVRFWGRGGLLPVRLGLSRGSSSGTHALVVSAPLSPAGVALQQQARSRFHAHLPHMLADGLTDLEPELAAVLLQRPEGVPPLDLDSQDWCDLLSFACGLRVYETCPAPVWRLACGALADVTAAGLLDAAGQTLLIRRVLQRQGWGATAAALGLPGRDAAVSALRRTLLPLVLHYADTAVAAQARAALAAGG
jgi:tRNA(Met) cytidine acetyltransferase